MNDGKVWKWDMQFKDGRENIHDAQSSGRPSNHKRFGYYSRCESPFREKINSLCIKISTSFKVCSLQSCIWEPVLHIRKLCSQDGYQTPYWESQIKNMRQCFPVLVFRYDEEGDGMLNQIVTGDGTWVSHHTLQVTCTILDLKGTCAANSLIMIKKWHPQKNHGCWSRL